MAVEPCVRVCLHLSDVDEETCWFLVDYKKMPTIECIKRVIGQKFYKSETTSFKLTLKGGLLPAWESSHILRDDDQVIVEHEATGCHSSEFWSKKRKRKKKPAAIHKKSCYSPSDKPNSPESSTAKSTGSSVHKQESILTPKISPNTVSSSPNAESEEQEKNTKKKKKKKKGLDELDISVEEMPAPNKRQKLSKSAKNESGLKKKNVTKDSKQEFIELDHVDVASPQCEKQKEGKANLCDKSESPHGLKRIKSEIIKVLDEVSVNLDNTSSKETSSAVPSTRDVSKIVKENSAEGNASPNQLTENYAKYLKKDVEPSAKSSRSDREKSYNIPEESSSHTHQEKGNTVLTQLTDNIEQKWRKDLSSKSSISNVEKSFNVQEFSSHSSEEKFEAYKIGIEDLKNLRQSLSDGETLTIDQDKVKIIDVENSSNSSSLDCVELESSFPDETKKLNGSTLQKEKSKGSGNMPRRRRRRRGQRSFACSPFIHEMSQSLDSEADNRSLVSTPVTSQPSKKHSSSNSSQKHFHFESESEEEEDVEEEEEEEGNGSHLKMTGDADPKAGNNFESSKPTLFSDKSVMNGAEDLNSSSALQGEEKNNLSSSQKHTPKKSVHFALENNSCQSFDSNEGPIIFKRGQNSNQRRAYPLLTRQQQLNSEDDKDSSVNCSSAKPSKEYNLLPSIIGYPRAGDKIAFKRLEIGDDYTPRLSDFIEAKVISFQEDTKKITMKVTSSQNNRKKEGKFELFYEDDKDIMILDDEPETVELSTLQEVKLLK